MKYHEVVFLELDLKILGQSPNFLLNSLDECVRAFLRIDFESDGFALEELIV